MENNILYNIHGISYETAYKLFQKINKIINEKNYNLNYVQFDNCNAQLYVEVKNNILFLYNIKMEYLHINISNPIFLKIEKDIS